nr:MAG TPA: hypothetical protein [Bacteriophage sp.]
MRTFLFFGYSDDFPARPAALYIPLRGSVQKSPGNVRSLNIFIYLL